MSYIISKRFRYKGIFHLFYDTQIRSSLRRILEDKYSLISLIVVEIKNMNRSFEAVLNSSINHSKSKEAHGFPKELRFKRAQSPICIRDSYDLSRLDMAAQIEKKRNSSSLSPRFRYRASFTPSPSDYKHKSFIEESKEMRRGPKLFTHDRIKQNRLSTSPGPGQYSPILRKTSPQITMSPRYQNYKNMKPKQMVSPAYYETSMIDSIGTKRSKIFSKYNNVSFYKIGQEKRFRDKNTHYGQPGPGSYNHPVDLRASNKTYSFGSAKKGLKNLGTSSPGPGAYQHFSQFADRRNRLQSKLNRLQQLMRHK